MAPERLRVLLRVTPFRPFRLHLSGGNSFLVTSPEWLLVTGLTSALGIPGQSGDGDRIMLIDNMHIVFTEPADAVGPTAAPTAN